MTSVGPSHQVDPDRGDWLSQHFSRILWVNAMLQVLIIVSGGVFVAEAHRLLRLAKAGAATKVLKPMRLFHFSITYVTLLFLAVAIDPIVHLAIR